MSGDRCLSSTQLSSVCFSKELAFNLWPPSARDDQTPIFRYPCLAGGVPRDAGNFFLVLDSFSINREIGMSEETPNFNINPDAGMIQSTEFTYIGHQVEIVPPDTAHLIGNYWQIKIDGILQRNFLFNSARVAADQAEKFIERQEEYSGL
jgi:hypothetical protein